MPEQAAEFCAANISRGTKAGHENTVERTLYLALGSARKDFFAFGAAFLTTFFTAFLTTFFTGSALLTGTTCK